jgi:hypothetical protein
VSQFLQTTLGPEVYEPVTTTYRKLRSSKGKEQPLASSPKRQTPRYLHIIALRDDKQQRDLDADLTGNLAVLKWDLVTEYTGLEANILDAPSMAIR